jgi:hypothetical protein
MEMLRSMRGYPAAGFLALLLAPALSAGAPDGKTDVWTGIERIVAVGDVHGNYVQFVRTLRFAGVINRENRWVGGKTHLVQIGDILDRGPYSKLVMDLLMALEKEAPGGGGMVHFLIGNHEAMVLSGDLRYVHRWEYDAFLTRDAPQKREELYRKHVEELKEAGIEIDPDFRKKWLQEHPLDRFQYLENMSPSGKYGKWILSHNSMIKINNVLFVHGGISSKYATTPLRVINRSIRQELRNARKSNLAMSSDEIGPLWFRGLTRGTGSNLRRLVDRVLATHGADRIVIGHTITSGGIEPRLAGRVIQIDVGMMAGPAACLVIEKGRYIQIYEGKRQLLFQEARPPNREKIDAKK